MAQLITVRLSKADQQPLGFRLQGGKDFGTPLVVQKVNGGSSAERAGLQAGDALIRVNNTDVYTLRHQEAQDTIRAAGPALELTVQRGGGTWRPSVTPTGSLPRPGSRLGASPAPVTTTSLKATPQPSRAFGSGHNNVAKPFGYMNGNDSVKSIVNKQYNTPVNMYSDKTIAETLSAQTEVLAGGVLGVNFKKNEKSYDAEKSAVFKVLQEEENDPEPVEAAPGIAPPVTGLRHVPAPVARPEAPINNTGGLPPGQNICEECERLITGVFVRIKDKNLHVECFKCSTCGSSLKNQGYYNLNGKLYCDIHAKLVARQNPPAPNLDPVTVPPGGRIPTNTYSTPLPPLSTNNYTNGSSSMFSPSSNLSGPKPFGSSIGSAYSPSLSPRSAPLSPATRPAPAYAPAPAPAYAPAPAPAYAPAPAPAPFAPTQTVKSIVWPPPNPPDDELPKHEPDSKAVCNKAGSDNAQATTGPVPMPQIYSDVQQITEQNLLSLSQQIKEQTSSMSYASASISTSTATSSKSESIVHSQQSQQKQETTSQIVQSYSEQASEESQSVMIYQSQTSPPVQKSFGNPLENITQGQIKEKTQVESILATQKKQNNESDAPSTDKRKPSEPRITTYSEVTKDSQNTVAQNEITTKINTENSDIQPKSKTESKDCKKSETQIKMTSEIEESTSKEASSSISHETIHESQTEIKNYIEQRNESLISTCNNRNDIVGMASNDLSKNMPSHEVGQGKNNLNEIIKLAELDNIVETQKHITRTEMPFENNISEAKEVIKEVVEDRGLNADCHTTKQSTILPNVGGHVSMVEALTIAPDRPYSPMPSAPLLQCADINPQPLNVPPEQSDEDTKANQRLPEKQEARLPSQPSPMFSQQPKRGITPIPPIKTYNPPESREAPIPMPVETTPYIPPDFKIKIEPKVPREEASSPLVDALTTAPNRPFTPVLTQPIERGSLREALTIAPNRPYSPLPLHTTTQSSQSSHYSSTSTVQVQSTCTEIIRPIATQTTTQITDHIQSEFSSMQNTYKLKSSSDMSAFRPVAKQVFPPPQPEEFCQLANFPPITEDLKSSFQKSTRSKEEMSISASKFSQQSVVTTATTTSSQAFSSSSQGYSSVKNAQQFFETLDQRESLTSTAVRSKSGLHKPDKIPPYQKNFNQLPSQRGITPEICLAPAIPQRPVTPTTDPPTKPREKSVEPKSIITNIPAETVTAKTSQMKAPTQQPNLQFQRNTPISMTFQPVSDDHFLRASPARSRPTTPSMINKPAPIIPHYQMNLVTVEHIAPETHMYDPSSREGSRSPTPKLRSRSPAPGPPPNPLKAQAPRLKETTPQRHTQAHNLLTQATSNLRKEHEMAQKDFHTSVDFNINPNKNWVQEPMINEQRHSNVGFKSECYNHQDMKIKEDSMINQNYGQRQMQSQNVAEYGNTTVQTTRKTFEEFERTQSAKVIEIRKGSSSSSTGYQHIDSNIRPSSINPKQVFPPPIMSMPTSQQSSSFNLTNDNVTNASRSIENCQPKPSISGANQGPVCDPTPSTGSSVGAAARGKTFGVSSAPKRGRGVLNKAAVPGSRVPLCASCNGNIRGPFITALGRIWCPDHFICVNATCKRPLQDIGFVEENGQLYCEYCFEQYIAPACDKCHAKIKGDCLNAIGKHFHPECFNCVYCGKLFGNNPFFLEDGLPYCESDWNELFTTKCFACGFPVEAGDRWVEALNNNYHSQCFNCTVCKKNLEGQSFFAKGGRPFCKTHAR